MYIPSEKISASQSLLPPRNPPTNMDWLQYKAIITKLYIDDDLQVPQLVAHMKTSHHFHATSNMYKKRLLAWNMRKNYRRQEKEAVLAHLEQQGEDAVRELQVHGKPVLLGRVRRFEREGRNARMAVPVQLVAEDVWTVDLQHDHSTKRRRKIPELVRCTRLPANRSNVMQVEVYQAPHHVIRTNSRAEHVLHLVCTLYDDALLREFDWHRSRRPNALSIAIREASRDTRSGWPPAAFVDVGLALHYLSARDSKSGFWYLDRACQELLSSLTGAKEDRLVEFHAMAEIVDVFSDPVWLAFPDLRRHLLLYLKRLAETREGRYHPLTLLWGEFEHRQTVMACRDVLQRRLNNGFERRIGAWKVRLKCQWTAREPPQLLYGHSQWRWEQVSVE